MGAEEVRRSTRDCKPVKTYAEEQAEEACEQHPRKRKRASASYLVSKESGKKLMQELAHELNDGEVDTDSRPTKKTKATPKKKSATIADSGDWHASAAKTRVANRMKRVQHLAPDQTETRLLGYVANEHDLPDKYWNALKKTTKDKMFVLERSRDVEEVCYANYDDCPCETLSIAGSKGSVYTVRISHLTTCNCPVSIFHNRGQESQCKHIIYVLHKVLRAPDHLKYQQAFLTSELKELFANAPRLPIQTAEENVEDGNRKEVCGACPICFLDFEEDDDLVWCQAACGNNLHADCFKAWEKSKTPVTCPFCRTVWQNEVAEKRSTEQKAAFEKVIMPTEAGKGGYLNVKHQLAYD